MLEGCSVLALVPARSGSKGLPDKNIRMLAGRSLIGHVAYCLDHLPWVDARVLSTDSEAYARIGRAAGLEVPFLRPAALATDVSTAVEVARHAIAASEAHFGRSYDLVLWLEPTSPLRRAEHVERAVRRLAGSEADAVVTVSPLDAHVHPDKVLRRDANGRLHHYTERGAVITARQQLAPLLIRNGICYAVRRRCIMELGAFITGNTLAEIIEDNFVNIDHELDFAWAEFLLSR